MSKKLVVAEKAHSELGASVAARWMACPGSVNLSRGQPNHSSDAAREGTAAHALAELALRKNQDPAMWEGATLEGIEVTEEMVDFVRVYVEHCNNLSLRSERTWIEHRFNLGLLNPPGPMFGTGDFAAYNPAKKRLYIADLKYGQGVVVEAKGNKQLRYYALGVLLSPELAGLEIHDIKMFIVQPRAAHPDGVIRHDVVSFNELIDFAGELMEAARQTQAPEAPLRAGSHCKFCPAAAICPEQLRRAQEVAMTEFSVVSAPTPPAPEALTREQIEQALPKLDVLEGWITSMRQWAHRELEAGRAISGYKLVQKRATRKWIDENNAAEWLKAAGEEEQDIYVRKLKSPAQMEKLVGKKNLPNDLVKAESSGLKMVPEHDPAPAVTMGEEFGVLAPASESK